MPFKTFKITPTLNCPDTDRRGRHIFITSISILEVFTSTSIYCPWLDSYIWDCKSPFGTDLIVSRENCVRREVSPSWEHFPSFMVVTKRRDCFPTKHNSTFYSESFTAISFDVGCSELSLCSRYRLLLNRVSQFWLSPNTPNLEKVWNEDMLIRKDPHWQAEQHKGSKKTPVSGGLSILRQLVETRI